MQSIDDESTGSTNEGTKESLAPSESGGESQRASYSDSNTKYDNLNLENTKITKYTPEGGNWKELSYHTFDMVHDAEDELNVEKIVKALGEDYSSDAVYYRYFYKKNGNNELEFLPYGTTTAEQFPGILSYFYLKDGFYLENNTGGMLKYFWLGDLRKINDEKPGDDDYDAWLFEFHGDIIKRHELWLHPEAFDEKYEIGSREQTVAEVNERLLEFVYKNPYDIRGVGLGPFTVEPHTVDVFKYKTGKQALYFTYYFKLDGVPIISWDEMGYPETGFQRESDEYDKLTSLSDVMFRLGTYSDDRCDVFESSPLTYNKYDMRVIDNSDILSYDEACGVVSDFMSERHVFDVYEAVLKYALVVEADKKVDENTANGGMNLATLQPVWRFTITNPGKAGMSVLYVYVTAEHGEIVLEYK
jgi:hypothetical protein